MNERINDWILRPGDWVEINCPEKPWFHGEIAEVAEVFLNSSVDLYLSKTPGHEVTHWQGYQLLLLECRPWDATAREVLGDGYFE